MREIFVDITNNNGYTVVIASHLLGELEKIAIVVQIENRPRFQPFQKLNDNISQSTTNILQEE